MNLADYHAKDFAHELTRRCSSDSIEKFASVLADAQMDLNPHQVEAALFAFRNPFTSEIIHQCPYRSHKRVDNMNTYRVGRHPLAQCLPARGLDLQTPTAQVVFSYKTSGKNIASRDEAWQSYDQSSREVDQQKEALLDEISKRLKQETKIQTLFLLRWVFE